jgi:hypothetical protein
VSIASSLLLVSNLTAAALPPTSPALVYGRAPTARQEMVQETQLLLLLLLVLLAHERRGT